MPWNIHVADLATVGLLVVLESLLSADNALVMAVMVLGLPDRLHQRALNFGLVGAIVFRLAATSVAVLLIHAAWPKLLGGLYLVYLAGSHFVRTQRARAVRPAAGPSRSFWGTVVRVELVNLAFSVDSILVAVAMSQKFWVVLTGGILGVLAMRVIVSQLVAWIRRYPRLIDGAFVIIAWVGLKLLLDYAHQLAWIGWEIPQALSLAGIALVLGLSYLLARAHPAVGAGSQGPI